MIHVNKDEYFIGNLRNPTIRQSIEDAFVGASDALTPATIGYDEESSYTDTTARNCHQIPINNNSFIGQGLSEIICGINAHKWQLPLRNEWDFIHYLEYREPGHRFKWHCDTYPGMSDDDRKLSIVYCISSANDYHGAEFQIRCNDDTIDTYKFDTGDFIVFPADGVFHQVNDLISGIRKVVVGFYC